MLAGVHSGFRGHHHRNVHVVSDVDRQHDQRAEKKTARKSIFAAGVDLDSLLALKPSGLGAGHLSERHSLSSVECDATLRSLLGIVLDLLAGYQVRVAMHFLEFVMGQDALALPLDSTVDWGAEGLFPSAVEFGKKEEDNFSETMLGMFTTLTQRANTEVSKEHSTASRHRPVFKRSKTEDFENEAIGQRDSGPALTGQGNHWGGSSGSASANFRHFCQNSTGPDQASHFFRPAKPPSSEQPAETKADDLVEAPGMMALLQRRRHTLGMEALRKDLMSPDLMEMSRAHEQKEKEDKEKEKEEKEKRHRRKHSANTDKEGEGGEKGPRRRSHGASPLSDKERRLNGTSSQQGNFEQQSSLDQRGSLKSARTSRNPSPRTSRNPSPRPSVVIKKVEDDNGAANHEDSAQTAAPDEKTQRKPCLSRQVSFATSICAAEPATMVEGTLPGPPAPSAPPETPASPAPPEPPAPPLPRGPSKTLALAPPTAVTTPTATVEPESSQIKHEHTMPPAVCFASDAEQNPAADNFTGLLPGAGAPVTVDTGAPAGGSTSTVDNADAAIAVLEAAAGQTADDEDDEEARHRKASELEVHFRPSPSVNDFQTDDTPELVHKSEDTEPSSSGLTAGTSSSEESDDDEDGDEDETNGVPSTNGATVNQELVVHPFEADANKMSRGDSLPVVLHKSEATSATEWTEGGNGAAYRKSVHAKVKGALSTKAQGLKRSSTGILAEVPGKISKIWDRNLEEDRAVFLGTASHFLIIHPSSTYRMCWDALCLIIIMMEATMLPMVLCFDVRLHWTVMWLSTCVFLPDILLNFVTGFYHNGVIILRQNIIIQRYMMSWFFLDVLSTMPWEVIFEASDVAQSSGLLRFAKLGKLLRVLRLLRVLKLRGMMQRVEEMFCSYMVLFILSIMKTILFFILVIHWVACLWGWIGSYDGDEEPRNIGGCEPDGPCEGGIGINGSPWRHRYAIDSAPRSYQYLTALQFATGLLTGAELPMSAGYWAERTFVIFTMVFGFLMCSTIISTIVVIMDRINQENKEYLEETRAIRDFMVARGMPLKLQTKVKRYLEYQFKSRKVVHQNHEVMLKLSPFLRLELTEHMNRSVLEHHPFFARMEPALFSEACCLGQSVLYAPGDIVVHKGRNSSSIVFLVRGQLEIQEVRNHFSVFVKPPAWIGDRGLFVTSVRHHNVVCSMHSELLTIRQHDLLELVEHFPTCEAYIAEYCTRIGRGDPTVVFCEYCRDSGHDLTTCEALTALAAEREGYESHEHDRRGFLKGVKLNNLLAYSPLAKGSGSAILSDITGSSTPGAAAKSLPRSRSAPININPLRRSNSTNVSKAQTKYDAWQGDI